MKDKPMSITPLSIPEDKSRRRFVTGMAAGSALLGLGLAPQLSYARQPLEPRLPETLTGTQFDLDIAYQPVNFTGRERTATAVNGTVPAPTLRWREGDRVKLRVTNHLAHDSSIHWHGLILPTEMDGVPGLSFDGIKPGETFEYNFDVQQSGTYWYHSHSGYQEQTGMYGAIVIDPKEPDPVAYDRDHVVLLSDWSDEAPENVYAKLKKLSDYYNFGERTVGDLWRDISEKGLARTWNERSMWNRMRMSERDISDVTGYTYTFLMNGQTPDSNWLGLFKQGEKVRLRFINGAAMSIFDVRIPGLKMTVVAADGQNIKPVTVDEFRIGVAETYDVIVEPSAESAYTVFAQTIDRSGYASGTLSPDAQWQAETPAMDPAPLLQHRDMGMAMGMDHSMPDVQSMNGAQTMTGTAAMAGTMSAGQGDMGSMAGMDHSQHSNQQHSQHGIKLVEQADGALGKAGFGSNQTVTHASTERGPQVGMRAQNPSSGLHDPGIGLRDHQQLYGRRVLTYGDIKNLYPTVDSREPSREIELHLTGNMNRYMWSINGVKFADADPLQLAYGERVRITLVNDTMMTHPMHLHGMWSELETGDPEYIPRKHTILVQPGSKISYLVTADARGRWAYHCHLLFHMPGMFREVRVN
jgi:CopA family copper-resistance protein